MSAKFPRGWGGGGSRTFFSSKSMSGIYTSLALTTMKKHVINFVKEIKRRMVKI